MKKFLIANSTQKQKLFSLYNGTVIAVQPGEHKIICMFDERAITEYTRISTNSWVNGVFITCDPKIMNNFTMDMDVPTDVDNTPIQDADVEAVGTDDAAATNTEDGVESTEGSTDTEDSNDTDDDTTVEDSDNTEDSDVDTTTPDSEEDTTSEDEDTSEEEDTSNTVTDDTTGEDLSSKSLTELRELCEAKGINAKRFTKTQCLTELTKTPESTN